MITAAADEPPAGVRLRIVLLRETAILLLFGLLAVVMTWPLAANLERAVTDPGDPLFSTWLLDRVAHAFLTGTPLWDANLFHPARNVLAFSENTIGIALPLVPLFALGVAPLTIHNLALILGFALCGYAAYVTARYLTGSTAAAIAGGIAFAFTGFRFHHLPHVHYVWSFWMPLMLLAAVAYARTPSWRRALLLAGAIVMNGLVSLTWFVFATPAAALTVVLLGFTGGRGGELRYWTRFASAMLLSAAVMAPVLLPYRTIAREYGMERRVEEVIPNGAEWQDWLVPNVQNRNYGSLSPRAAYSHERTLFPGFVILALCAIGLGASGGWRPVGGGRTKALLALDVLLVLAAVAAWLGWLSGRVRLGALSFSGPNGPLAVLALAAMTRLWLGRTPHTGESARRPVPPGLQAAILWIALGALGARGLNGFLYSFLFDHVSAYRGMRMPVRWVMVSWVGIAVVVAAGMTPLLRSRSRMGRAFVAFLICSAMLFELRAAPVRYFLMPLEPRPVYEWLRDTPLRGAVLELPMTQASEYEYAWRSTVHRRPLLNGVSSFVPPSYQELRAAYDLDPIPDALFERLERDGCSVVIVHGGALRERSPAVRDWLRRGLDGGRLAFVRRFDEGDWVFAVRRVEPRSGVWRAPESPDAAGRTPSQNLAAFLGGEHWFATRAPFVMLDRAPFGVLRGPQEFAGWAHAHDGVREVRLRFGSGRASVRAELFDRHDLRPIFPWAPEGSMRGFRATVERPRFVFGETDFQAEIVHASGRRTLAPPMFFEWRDPVPVTMTWDPARLAALLTRLGADPARDTPRVIAGTAAIGDFTRELSGDPLRETDSAFVERVLPLLLGGPPPARLSNRALSLLAAGVPRERVIDAVLESREFREAYAR